jgi:hypothetical protein
MESRLVVSWRTALRPAGFRRGRAFFIPNPAKSPLRHSFRVRHDPGTIGRGDRADHIYGFDDTPSGFMLWTIVSERDDPPET